MATGEWLDDIGCWFVYLPTYSTEMDPAEYVLNYHRFRWCATARGNISKISFSLACVTDRIEIH